jgi:hypothetical protein
LTACAILPCLRSHLAQDVLSGYASNPKTARHKHFYMVAELLV